MKTEFCCHARALQENSRSYSTDNVFYLRLTSGLFFSKNIEISSVLSCLYCDLSSWLCIQPIFKMEKQSLILKRGGGGESRCKISRHSLHRSPHLSECGHMTRSSQNAEVDSHSLPANN